MPNNINWNLASQQFSEGFNSTFQQGRDLVQRESEFTRQQGFQDRQLRLLEGFRRDELSQTAKYHDMLGNYYQGQIEQGQQDAQIRIDEGKSKMFAEGWRPTDENTSIQDSNTPMYQAYGQSWIAPPDTPVEQSRWVSGPQGTSVEQKYTVDPAGKETITNYESIISPPEPTGNNSGGDNKPSQFDTFYNEGLSYLDEIKNINSPEVGGREKEAIQYNEAKQKATLNAYQAIDLAFTGVDTKILLESLRANAEGVEDPVDRRKALDDAINKLDKQYQLTPEQLKALKLWNEVGTR